MAELSHLYFHSPCFDGIVSAVLATDFFERGRGTPQISLQSVNYDARTSWLSRRFAEPFGVVDFLYHPRANFWADHHGSTFLDVKLREDYGRRRGDRLVYNPAAGSCAALLWEYLADAESYRNTDFEGLVEWADRIDSARYRSVEEVIEAHAPVLRLNLGLAVEADNAYCVNLVHLLRYHTVDEVALLPESLKRYQRAQVMVQDGLERFKRAACLEADGIVTFDVDGRGTMVSRYAPFYCFPNARYSAGIVRTEAGAKISAMRNPWRDFPSVALGSLFERIGGGGHHRVAAVLLTGDKTGEAGALLSRVVSEIRVGDRVRQAASH